MKFRGHDNYSIRRGWLSKGMREVKAHPDVFISKDEARRPSDVLGISSSTVRAFRYWMQATGLTHEQTRGTRVQWLTKLGELVFHYDPYLEDKNTLWLIHYRLASNRNDATSWYYFFNEFNMHEFTKDDFVSDISKAYRGKATVQTFDDDFNCLVRTYLNRKEKVSPEDISESPLTPLNLIKVSDAKRKTYVRRTPKASEIDPWIVLAVILDQRGERKEITFETLLSEPCNIGRVFNLDSIALMEVLGQTERTGAIKMIRTAGLDYIVVRENLSFLDCVRKYYSKVIKPSYQI